MTCPVFARHAVRSLAPGAVLRFALDNHRRMLPYQSCGARGTSYKNKNTEGIFLCGPWPKNLGRRRGARQLVPGGWRGRPAGQNGPLMAHARAAAGRGPDQAVATLGGGVLGATTFFICREGLEEARARGQGSSSGHAAAAGR